MTTTITTNSGYQMSVVYQEAGWLRATDSNGVVKSITTETWAKWVAHHKANGAKCE